MASKKSKVLAIAFCAAVMSGIYASPALAGWGDEHVSYDEGTVSSDIGDLKNPSLHHPNGPHYDDADCGEEVDGTDVTIGDLNKVIDDLVDNDKKVANKVDEVATTVDKINEAYESGALKGEQGEKGEDGKDGQDGKDGVDGKDGKDGVDGKDGKDGVDGKDGKDGVDGKDGASIASGEYNVQDGTGIVQMPIEDEDGNKVGDVQINNIASQNDLKDETAARENADKELADKIGQEEMNRVNEDAAIRGEIGTEHAERVEADQELADKIGQEEMNRVNADAAIRGEISQEHADRVAADQELADKIGQEEMNRVNEDAAIRGEISKEHADRVAADQELENKIDQETTDREKADADLQADINAKEEQSKDRDEQLQANIDAEEQARKDADDALQADINAKEEQSKYRDEQLQQSIDIQREVIGAGSTEELKGAYSGTNYISDAENMVEADRKLDAAISDVNSRVDGLEGRIDKVGAMSAAIANLRTMGYDPAAPTEVAVGVGQYRDETGMALGLFHYPNRDFMLSLSVSTSGDEYMGGIGATWKFGRKSPEKVAEIKKAQAEADAKRVEEQKLAKAEEMKKAAKEAKVQAQMERHAKMLAEQEAQA